MSVQQAQPMQKLLEPRSLQAQLLQPLRGFEFLIIAAASQGSS